LIVPISGLFGLAFLWAGCRLFCCLVCLLIAFDPDMVSFTQKITPHPHMAPIAIYKAWDRRQRKFLEKARSLFVHTARSLSDHPPRNVRLETFRLLN
jgi:hypothetical protein